jgi:TolB-like protein/Tfp pilus assembly protein PilF
MRYQWTRLAGGEPTPEFVTQVKRLLEAPRKPGPGQTPVGGGQTSDVRGQRAEDGGRATEPARKRRGGWKLAVAAVVVFGLSAYFGFRPAPAPSGAPTAPTSPAPAIQPPPDFASAKSVAVLAFADLSEARNSEYFSDGVSEELLNVLAKVPGLRVAARTSAFFFKGKNLPIPEIAQKLNVAYVVEGSVQRAGDRVKITAQLIKAADGFHVWSDTFTREAKDVFAVQEEIAGRIAQELSLKLGVTSAAATVNPQALELYLQGRQAWNLRTVAGFARAEELFNRALTLEPNFARAVSALADVWLVQGSSGGAVISRFGQRNSPAHQRIVAQIERALALDPKSAEAHASLGNARWNNWQLPEAARALRQAVALNPNYATAHQWLGRVLMADGYYDEALAALRRATELDPLSSRIQDNYAIGLRAFGRYAEALAADERALALQPGSDQASVWRTLDLAGLGRHEEAVADARRLIATSLSQGYERFLIRVFVKAGARADAEALLKQIPATEPGRLFRSLAELGRLQDALAMVEPAALGIQDMGDLLVSAEFDPVRHDPQWVKLIATLGLTDAHARAQAWRKANPPRGRRQ